MMVEEIKSHLINDIIPFWKSLRDDEFGGYYGWVDYDLKVDKEAVKGCILNSRIMWFFSNAYTLLKDESLLNEAKHGFNFMKEYCMDKENGGIFWSLKYNGEPEESLKHTYNQAFAIYALSSYYDAFRVEEALQTATDLFRLIENKSVYENVAFAMRAIGAREAEIRDRVPYILELVGLENKSRRHPTELSGGEQQRLAIARALINNPSTIIADEPTGNLDPAMSLEIMSLLQEINNLGTTMLVVTHERDLVERFGKRVIAIDDGLVVHDGMDGYYRL